ncbi:copper amine oxidase-like protein [Natranaerovirga hydrolytica]|uniref:Copper amine oxidase-like protein n=1 Tax=Natranaerovirga hydrolytica TaxID=680378 RepID=A0A4R1MM82_9FIRM|nr:phage tail tip lysozyme [Natranaerovirga hydrolytica]TCK93200.1 copper amine oxidase-like protein [Natranaerovirga hydrolytica]
MYQSVNQSVTNELQKVAREVNFTGAPISRINRLNEILPSINILIVDNRITGLLHDEGRRSVLVDLYELGEALDLDQKVGWDEGAKSDYIIINGTRIYFPVGNLNNQVGQIEVNQKNVTYYTNPRTGGRVMVDVREFIEAVGGKVTWESYRKSYHTTGELSWLPRGTLRVEMEPEGTGQVNEVFAIPLTDATRLSEEQQQANATYIYNYLTGEGWEKEAISALLGNIQQESQMNPGVWQRQDNTRLAYGLVQWEPATKFLDWNEGEIKTEKLSVDDVNDLAQNNPKKLIDMQLEFLTNSMKPGQGEWIPSIAVSKHNAPYRMSSQEFINSTNDIAELTVIFNGHYERSSKPHMDNRIKYAEYWYKYFSN